MVWEVSCIIFYALVLSSSASTVILSPSGNNATFCLGQTGHFTCEVSGPVLFWEYTGYAGVGFSTGALTTRLLGPDIEVELLSVCSAPEPFVRSMATVTVTSSINGTQLLCRSSVYRIGTPSKEVDFYVLSKLLKYTL
ncbi:PREDICTED: uncharacterized protein LOC109592126 [Amphimedon queenslandica]|uniref:Ig-like domain-containing protein n=1 Tax=Amphimedon queenslandica TaxID=400682 RepID=A0AAN0K1J8_AMPQE|nr:PREDICTED: uncharacterized protein LOC109592126 [Amphimedon queenslandica]|eukprot:XP_019863224.1 PREDICTED: uncharacterized protein LOC109592126 [Amphimedon queenslandica]